MKKCLVIKAKEECECHDCKFRRSLEVMSLQLQVQETIFRIMSEGLMEKKVRETKQIGTSK